MPAQAHRDPATAGRLRDRLEARCPAMVDDLARLAAIESPSLDPESQRPVQAILGARLEALGWHPRRHRGRQTGGLLFARPPRDTGRYQLLVGHTDTVWPIGTLAAMPVERDGETLRGPGVFDMKAGLVMIVHALEALQALALAPALTPLVLINADEEIGSRESGPHIRRLARLADRALILEPALGPGGKLKTARKGIGQLRVTVIGRSAHAGLDPESGASAILAMARLVEDLQALADPALGTSVNVGLIEGGSRANVVPAECRAVVDLRVPSEAAGAALMDRVRALRSRVPGTRLRIEGGIGRPPMEPTPANRRLWTQAREAGRALGLELDEASVGGGSDGNLTSPYTATLDGLGPIGDGAHAPHEQVHIPSLPERTALLALLMLAPAPAPPKEAGRPREPQTRA